MLFERTMRKLAEKHSTAGFKICIAEFNSLSKSDFSDFRPCFIPSVNLTNNEQRLTNNEITPPAHRRDALAILQGMKKGGLIAPSISPVGVVRLERTTLPPTGGMRSPNCRNEKRRLNCPLNFTRRGGATRTDYPPAHRRDALAKLQE